MKKLFHLSLVSAFLLSACQKELSHDPPGGGNGNLPGDSVVFKTDKAQLNLAATAPAPDSFAIQSNISWTVAVTPAAAGWLQVSKTSGSSNAEIIVTATQSNMADTVRVASITVSPVNRPGVHSITIGIAQQPAVRDTAKNVYGGTALDEFAKSVPSGDGGFISIGETNSHDGDVSGVRGQEDIWVVKTDAKGKLVWQKTFGGSDRDFGTCITASADGNGFVIGGWVMSADGDAAGSHGNGDMWIAKIDNNGNITWKKTYGGGGIDDPAAITVTADGGYFITGITTSNDGDVSGNHGGNDGWVLKIDGSGNKVWQKTLGGTGYDVFASGIATTDGGYLVAGDTQSNDGNVSGNHGYDDMWVVKLDASGAIQWQKCFGGTGGEYAAGISLATDGGYVIAGSTDSWDGDVSGLHGGRDAWLLKIDVSGNKVWQKCFGGTGNDDAYSITKTAAGGYVISGELRSPDLDAASYKGGDGDAWIIKTDVTGNQQAQRMLGGTDEEWGSYIFENGTGNFVMVGTTYSYDKDIIGHHGYGDAWLMQVKL